MDFTKPWDFGDITFVVEDKKMYVNRVALAMSSEVFKTMFTSEFKEKEMAKILLPDKKFEDVLQLMQVLHPQANKCVDAANAICLLPLAHEYQIHHVVENCEKFLMTEPSIHNLILADKLSLPKLRHVCIEYAKGVEYHQLVKDPGFKKLDYNTVLEVFHAKLKRCDGEEKSEEASQKLIKKLESEQPSIQNLGLAQKYNLKDVYKKCLEYVITTPLSLFWATLYLSPGTLTQVFQSKMRQFNGIRGRIYKISRGAEPDNSQECTNEGASPAHSLGEASGTLLCLACLHYNMDKIQTLVKAEF